MVAVVDWVGRDSLALCVQRDGDMVGGMAGQDREGPVEASYRFLFAHLFRTEHEFLIYIAPNNWKFCRDGCYHCRLQTTRYTHVAMVGQDPEGPVEAIYRDFYCSFVSNERKSFIYVAPKSWNRFRNGCHHRRSQTTDAYTLTTVRKCPAGELLATAIYSSLFVDCDWRCSLDFPPSPYLGWRVAPTSFCISPLAIDTCEGRDSRGRRPPSKP